MRATRIMPNLRVADVEAAKGFYTGYLGLSVEEFNMGWAARYTSPDARRSSSSSRATPAHPQTPSFPSSLTTSKKPMKKPGGLVMRSCIR